MRKTVRHICVYAARHLESGKFNIGSTLCYERRKREHIYQLKNCDHPNPYLQAAWNKYGEAAFVWGIIEEYLSEDGLKEREQGWIEKYKSYDPKFGYNVSYPVKQRNPSKLMSAAHTNYWSHLSPEEKAARVAHLKDGSIQKAATAGKRKASSRERASLKAKEQLADNETANKTREAIRKERKARLADSDKMAAIGNKIRIKARARWKDPEYRKWGLSQLDSIRPSAIAAKKGL